MDHVAIDLGSKKSQICDGKAVHATKRPSTLGDRHAGNLIPGGFWARVPRIGSAGATARR
jgi:hypothetical protein